MVEGCKTMLIKLLINFYKHMLYYWIKIMIFIHNIKKEMNNILTFECEKRREILPPPSYVFCTYWVANIAFSSLTRTEGLILDESLAVASPSPSSG